MPQVFGGSGSGTFGGAGAFGVFSNLTVSGGNVPYVWVHYAIPIINLGSGSMGNNGALSGITALGTTYANAYVLVPAGAIAAGVPASPDYYYAQFSSTTVATLFNNTLSANLDAVGGPTIPASPTAFSTTGPGAFTAATTATTMLTLTLPAASMSATGELYVDFSVIPTNNANAKTSTVTFGGTNLFNQSIASVPAIWGHSEISNRNSASVQSSLNYMTTGSNTVTGTFQVYSAVNTAAAVSIAFLSNHSGAATDNIVLERIKIAVLK